jgi:hypothetical protein
MRVWYKLPKTFFMVALFGALLNIAPVWRAQLETPPAWTFTGNLSGSPDVMQYRIFTRRSQITGPIVDNTMTTEPNSPYLPVLFYYAIGEIASWLDVPDPFVTDYLGVLLAFVLVILLFLIVDHFIVVRYQTWWVFLVLLFGGGFGAHLLLISQIVPLNQNFLIRRTIVEGLSHAIVFDQYRNHYIFSTLFDTHFLFFLIVALSAIGTFYLALKDFSYPRWLLTAALFGATTVLHVYDGITLLAVGMGVTFVLWRKRYPLRPALLTLGVCTLSVGAAILWQMALVNSSGISISPWRADAIYASELILAYPIAWGLIAWGVGGYWRRATFQEIFLLGWALGCTALTLSGPFYPYPDRGTLTLQIPLYIIAGKIFFARYSRVPIVLAGIAIMVLGATPAYVLYKQWLITNFSDHPDGSPPPHVWMSPEHKRLVETLEHRALANDVLVVDKADVPWKTDDLWLAPSFPGKLYAGHYFQTVDYSRKREETNHFFAAGNPEEKAEFLRKTGVRFVYVNSAKQDPVSFESVPGLVPIVVTSVGSLFEYQPRRTSVNGYGASPLQR